jgi:glycosyltransferase involved in cell wall biosynthesis
MDFKGRLGLVQRVCPTYRVPFFEMLGGHCKEGLCLFAGSPRSAENIPQAGSINDVEWVHAHNIHMLQGKLYACWQGGILSWLKDWQPDVLIVEANPRYLSTPSAIRWMHAHQKPVIGWGLGAKPYPGAKPGFLTLSRKRFLQHFDAMITYSQSGAEEYARIGLDLKSIFVAVNAVTPRPTNPPPIRSNELQAKPKVLFVGRLQARKRVDHLIKACAALPVGLQPDLWVVGDGPEKVTLEELAKKVYPATHFTGAKFGADLDLLFDQADLFVLPGTGGLAIQQAMSHALPVIAAEADGTQENLLRPVNGWQIPPADLPQLTHTLEIALSDIPRLRQMGAESFRLVSEEINLESMVDAFMHAIDYARQRRK